MLSKCLGTAVWLHTAGRESLAFSKGKLVSQMIYRVACLQNNQVQTFSQSDIVTP